MKSRRIRNILKFADNVDIIDDDDDDDNGRQRSINVKNKKIKVNKKVNKKTAKNRKTRRGKREVVGEKV